MSPAQFESDGRELPDFDRPPVVEVVLGVEFQPVPNLGAANLTRLADGWVERYPLLEEMPPLPPSPLPGSQFDLPGVVVSVGAPAVRMWRLSAARDQLLQVQRDRLLLNWQRQEAATYPHYDQLRPPFRDALSDLVTFVEREGLGTVRPTAAEVTYVNRLDQDPDGTTALRQTIRGASLQSERLGRPGVLRINQAWNREHEGRPAVLSITADSTPIGGAILSLSYREALLSSFQVIDVLAALDRGHADIVTTFLEVTTDEMHARWGRRR
jgi:uncharacterized protein (TIGR04255 family)